MYTFHAMETHFELLKPFGIYFFNNLNTERK